MNSIGSRIRRVTIGIATFAVVMGTVVVAAPAADAVPNRRICQYGGITQVPSIGSRQVFALNYKKTGGCPTIRNGAALAATVPTTTNTKITCEEFGSRIGVSYDPCHAMAADNIYRVRFGFASQDPIYFTYGHYNG